MLALAYTIIPVIAVVLGAIVAVVRRPGPAFTYYPIGSCGIDLP